MINSESKSSLFARIYRDIDYIFMNILFKSFDLLGDSGLGANLRPFVLRRLGFNIGKEVKILEKIGIKSLKSHVSIDDGTFINRNVFFDSGAAIKIGKNCDIGFNSVFTTARHETKVSNCSRRQGKEALPIVIGDNVWLGCNVVVLAGVRIGDNAVVAAGSVVTKDVLPNTLVGGIPAKILKDLTEEERCLVMN